MPKVELAAQTGPELRPFAPIVEFPREGVAIQDPPVIWQRHVCEVCRASLQIVTIPNLTFKCPACGSMFRTGAAI